MSEVPQEWVQGRARGVRFRAGVGADLRRGAVQDLVELLGGGVADG